MNHAEGIEFYFGGLGQSSSSGQKKLVSDIRRMEAELGKKTPKKTVKLKLKVPAETAPVKANGSKKGILHSPKFWIAMLIAGVVGAAALSVYLKPKQKRKNPETEEAEDFFESFHWGRKPNKNRRVSVPEKPKKLVELGRLNTVSYITRKGDDEEAEYIHEFGEDGGEAPVLAAEPRSRKLHIVGGDYDVREEGIVG